MTDERKKIQKKIKRMIMKFEKLQKKGERQKEKLIAAGADYYNDPLYATLRMLIEKDKATPSHRKRPKKTAIKATTADTLKMFKKDKTKKKK